MALLARDVLAWIQGIPPDWTIYIDEDGLTLSAVGPCGQLRPYIEVGGEPEPSHEPADKE